MYEKTHEFLACVPGPRTFFFHFLPPLSPSVYESPCPGVEAVDKTPAPFTLFIDLLFACINVLFLVSVLFSIPRSRLNQCSPLQSMIPRGRFAHCIVLGVCIQSAWCMNDSMLIAWITCIMLPPRLSYCHVYLFTCSLTVRLKGLIARCGPRLDPMEYHYQPR